MSGTIVHIQCITDILCMPLGESLIGVGLRSGNKLLVGGVDRLCVSFSFSKN